MTPEHWQRIKSLLESALDRKPAERSAFLNEACSGDESLRREVESYIISHEQAGGFIEEPAYGVMAEMLADSHAGSLVGHSLGPYLIIATLGGGGMGEVYRARDTRLGREVAIKVLPATFSTDTERLRRFEQEARAASALNHPNILVIHELGTENGSPYLVTELLEGETLRQRLNRTTLPTRKTIDYALQIARGLAAAHERGIIHRDLKPENLFITRDGQVKILDFGLAKLIQPTSSSLVQTEAPTLLAGADTNSGMVMGTAGYMSPEQVRGQAVDHRSDIFSFGAILYEMVSGKRAFRRESAIETMNAILKEEPAELLDQSIPAALERVVRHCLEKNPEERFQSARDLAFVLEALSSLSSQSARAATVTPARSKLRQLLPFFLGALLLAAVALAAFRAGRGAGETSPPSFQRLTFRRGYIHAARFAPDGRTIVYAAGWEGQPIQLFSMQPESPESRPLGFPDADLLSISSSGEMAVSLGRYSINTWIHSGTLARMPFAGTAPREILEDVQWADWAPDGAGLAVVRDVGGRNRLEFPVGKVLYETASWISHPRISPKGDLIAFLDHTFSRIDDAGSVAIVDLTGNKRTLSSGHHTERGLAWSPNGDEVWFSAGQLGNSRALYAVTLSGKQRLVTRMAGGLTLNDISRDGRVLITRDTERGEINCLPPGETKERDLSWHDWASARYLSDDGKTLLIAVAGDAGGEFYSSYLRKTDYSPAIRLGEGWGLALSPDGKWAMASVSRSSPVQLVLLPTGTGEAKPLTNDAINYSSAQWFPDGTRLLFQGDEPGHATRLYLRELAGGTPRAITPEGVTVLTGNSISPDGKFVAGVDPDRKVWIYPVQGGEPRMVLGLAPGDLPLRWHADGRSLYVGRLGELPVKIYRLDLLTGRKELWKEIMPADPGGLKYISRIVLTPDGKSYAYSYYRSLSDLYLIDGLK